jgi:hypothetical protein
VLTCCLENGRNPSQRILRTGDFEHIRNCTTCRLDTTICEQSRRVCSSSPSQRPACCNIASCLSRDTGKRVWSK